jgi:hypothetical protein
VPCRDVKDFLGRAASIFCFRAFWEIDVSLFRSAIVFPDRMNPANDELQQDLLSYVLLHACEPIDPHSRRLPGHRASRKSDRQKRHSLDPKT